MAISVKTIIIGAGVSGLACANRLYSAGEDFLVITKDIGGRIKSSAVESQVGMGGVYINKDYFNLRPFVDIIEPFRVCDFFFFNGKKYKRFFSFGNIKFFPKTFRFLLLLWRFRNHLNAMRKGAEQEELRVLIEGDRLLREYWRLPVTEFLKRYGFEELDFRFGQPTAGTNFFTASKEMNTFYYMYLFLTLVRPSYIVDLSKTAKRLSQGFESKILIDTVVSLEKQATGKYLVTASKNQYLSENVVIAAPYSDIVDAYKVPKPSKTSSVFTYYVTGQRRPEYAHKKGVVLHPNFHDAYLLWRQRAGGDLIYAKTGDMDLSKYYESVQVKERIFWKTAAHIPDGSAYISQRLDKGLYLASDYNFSLMEDAFVTGLYAANQIIAHDSEISTRPSKKR